MTDTFDDMWARFSTLYVLGVEDAVDETTFDRPVLPVALDPGRWVGQIVIAYRTREGHIGLALPARSWEGHDEQVTYMGWMLENPVDPQPGTKPWNLFRMVQNALLLTSRETRPDAWLPECFPNPLDGNVIWQGPVWSLQDLRKHLTQHNKWGGRWTLSPESAMKGGRASTPDKVRAARANATRALQVRKQEASERNDRLRKYFSDGVPVEQIAVAEGISIDAVRRAVSRLQRSPEHDSSVTRRHTDGRSSVQDSLALELRDGSEPNLTTRQMQDLIEAGGLSGGVEASSAGEDLDSILDN